MPGSPVRSQCQAIRLCEMRCHSWVIMLHIYRCNGKLLPLNARCSRAAGKNNSAPIVVHAATSRFKVAKIWREPLDKFKNNPLQDICEINGKVCVYACVCLCYRANERARGWWIKHIIKNHCGVKKKQKLAYCKIILLIRFFNLKGNDRIRKKTTAMFCSPGRMKTSELLWYKTFRRSVPCCKVRFVWKRSENNNQWEFYWQQLYLEADNKSTLGAVCLTEIFTQRYRGGNYDEEIKLITVTLIWQQIIHGSIRSHFHSTTQRRRIPRSMAVNGGLYQPSWKACLITHSSTTVPGVVDSPNGRCCCTDQRATVRLVTSMHRAQMPSCCKCLELN